MDAGAAHGVDLMPINDPKVREKLYKVCKYLEKIGVAPPGASEKLREPRERPVGNPSRVDPMTLLPEE
jgi:hypothetical protein